MLPCPTQSIRIRDGRDAWMSELIGEYTGRGAYDNGNVVSSGNLVLIDFHLNDSQIANNICYAGFIGHVELIGEHGFHLHFHACEAFVTFLLYVNAIVILCVEVFALYGLRDTYQTFG